MSHKFSPHLVDFDVRVQDGHHVGGGGPPPGHSGVSEASLLIVPHSLDEERRVLLLQKLHVSIQVSLEILWRREARERFDGEAPERGHQIGFLMTTMTEQTWINDLKKIG